MENLYYVGIDLGTSSCKGILTNKDGDIFKEESYDYDVHYFGNCSEQNPQDWLDAVTDVIDRLSEGIREKIAGISIAGQMHGLVMLDENDEVIRPAILWNDGRSRKQTAYLNDVIGKEKLSNLTGNIAFSGFTAPKILWVYENEPENFKKIRKICLPKDYIAYKLTGVFSTEYSDASGMLLLDVKSKKWSEEMCGICHVDEKWLPRLFESYEAVGKLKPEYGLKNAMVIAGAGDNASAAIGTATVNNGDCNVSLGTSGTVFVAMDNFFAPHGNTLHSFAHSTGKYHLMGCILSAASCNKWWIEDILKTKNYDGEIDEQKLGENDVIFLPYLMGERSPHNNEHARGAFFGMKPDTSRGDMTLSVLEGVAFALRDCVEIARQNGVTVNKINLCGGGAKGKVWRKVIANVLNVSVYMTKTEQSASYGASILSMVGTGAYKDVYEATSSVVKSSLVEIQDSETVEKYNKKYEIYKHIYPALVPIYEELYKGE